MIKEQIQRAISSIQVWWYYASKHIFSELKIIKWADGNWWVVEFTPGLGYFPLSDGFSYRVDAEDCLQFMVKHILPYSKIK